MTQDNGASALPTGLSQAEPEVSALRASIPSAWECFVDRSYFDLWCVREIGSRQFGDGFHVIAQAEAERLRDFLNGRTA